MMRRIFLKGLLLFAIGIQACKKENVKEPGTELPGREHPEITIDAIRQSIAERNNLKMSDVGYDEKHGYFSIYKVNTIRFETALTDFLSSKQTGDEKNNK